MEKRYRVSHIGLNFSNVDSPQMHNIMKNSENLTGEDFASPVRFLQLLGIEGGDNKYFYERESNVIELLSVNQTIKAIGESFLNGFKVSNVKHWDYDTKTILLSLVPVYFETNPLTVFEDVLEFFIADCSFEICMWSRSN